MKEKSETRGFGVLGFWGFGATEAVQTPGVTLRSRRSNIPSSAFVVQQQRHSSFQASSSSVTSVQGQADIGASALQVVGLQVHTPAGSADPFSSSRVVSTSSKNSKLKTVEPPTYAHCLHRRTCKYVMHGVWVFFQTCAGHGSSSPVERQYIVVEAVR